MANTSSQIFVNPEGVKESANKIKDYAGSIKSTLEEISTAIQGTESNYESEAANNMRSQFKQLHTTIEAFESYLKKVASYLEVNVADPTSSVIAANVQNVANIRKPQ